MCCALMTMIGRFKAIEARNRVECHFRWLTASIRGASTTRFRCLVFDNFHPDPSGVIVDEGLAHPLPSDVVTPSMVQTSRSPSNRLPPHRHRPTNSSARPTPSITATSGRVFVGDYNRHLRVRNARDDLPQPAPQLAQRCGAQFHHPAALHRAAIHRGLRRGLFWPFSKPGSNGSHRPIAAGASNLPTCKPSRRTAHARNAGGAQALTPGHLPAILGQLLRDKESRLLASVGYNPQPAVYSAGIARHRDTLGVDAQLWSDLGDTNFSRHNCGYRFDVRTDRK
jgi:hypothetical protein